MRRLVPLVCIALTLMLIVSLSVVYAFDHGKGGFKGCSKEKGYSQKGLDDKFNFKAHLFLGKREELGLTDEQVEKIKDLKLKVKKELIMKEAEIKVLGLDIQTAMQGDSVDVEATNAVIDKKYEAKKAKAKFLIKSYAELKDILTKAQKSKLEDHWKKKKEDKGN